jgi:hypothetical protein
LDHILDAEYSWLSGDWVVFEEYNGTKRKAYKTRKYPSESKARAAAMKYVERLQGMVESGDLHERDMPESVGVGMDVVRLKGDKGRALGYTLVDDMRGSWPASPAVLWEG